VTLSRLILLRHGQTDFNVAGRMQGHLESVLTPIGRAQAAAAAPVVAALAPDRLISSDLSRAADTAELVGAVCGLPVKLDARLRETHLGQWQGMSVDEIEAEYPGAIATWRSDAAWAPPGGGESRIQVVERSRPVVDEVDAEPSDGGSEALLVVAHGGLIAGLVSGLLDLPARAWPAIGGLGNCRWAVLARRPNHPRWRLAGYNVGA
jgi:glucosyl-3-phosphoglycerate phosphatase